MVRTARALRSARTLGTTGVPAAFACLASLALLATTLSACGRGNLASHLTPTPDLARASNQARCGVAKSHDRPLIIEWPSAERAALESAVRRDDHLIVVRYSGCDMEVLRHCRAQGRYTFASVQRKDDNSYLRSADELYAKIPLGAAHLEAELERHGALHLAMTYIGAYEADPTGISEALDVSKLKGRCEGATHVVTNLNVGAFVLSSAAGAEIQAGAELGPPASLGRGPRGGASSTHSRGFRSKDGDPSACDDYSRSGPPDGCGALLGLEVEALSAPKSGDTSTDKRNPRGQPCPRGSVLVEGGIYTPSSLSENVWGDGWGGNQSVADLCVGVHEVTVAEYRRCVRDGACSQAPTSVDWSEISDDEREQRSRMCNGSRTSRRHHPVNCVSWHQAESYCRAQGGRLPSEAEWEWTARGGDQQRTYAWGEDDPDPKLVNACGRECSKQESLFDRRDHNHGTAKVGSYRSGRGRWYLEDLAGNVWEWTQSGDPRERVIRGGGFWSIDDDDLRVGGRERVEIRTRRADIGFRCVWQPIENPQT